MDRLKSPLLWAALSVLAVLIVRTAWLCDDAYITFRTVDNFNSGYGLTWNVTERVQVYTHPLWMFLISAVYSYTGEAFYSVTVLSILISLAASGLAVFAVARDRVLAFCGAVVLCLSKAFVDYSTSGLENPLTHLLLVVFFVIFIGSPATPRRLFLLSLVASLAAVNRLDSLIFYLPPLAAAAWKFGLPRAAGLLLAGFFPLVLWEVFSVFYYGFPFPNTAYAKLGTGIPRGELLVQGLFYLWNSLRLDPVTPVAVVSGALLALRDRAGRTGPLAAGLAGYMVYIVWIGGDFMSGRFLSPVVFLAVLLMMRIDRTAAGRVLFAGAAVVVLLAGSASFVYRAVAAERVPLVDSRGIADERRVYPELGLWNVVRNRSIRDNPWVRRGMELRARDEPTVEVAGGIGLLGYYAGPVAHVLDIHALSDPLLARLPAEPGWRIGHFIRDRPKNFIHSLRAERNLLHDPDLRAYYDRLLLITRGPLPDRRRLAEIARINLGRYDHHIEAYRAREGDRAHGPDGSGRPVATVETRSAKPH